MEVALDRLQPDIQELMDDLFDPPYRCHVTPERIREVVSQQNVYLFLKRTSQDRVISLVVLGVTILFSRRLGVIEEVVTLKPFRNRGYSTELIQTALAKARELNLQCVELTVREDRPEIQQYYKGLGFRDRGQRCMRLML